MKGLGAFAVGLLLVASPVAASNFIPAGTVIPVELNSSLSSATGKPGKKISARVAQNVPLGHGAVIRRGSKVFGEVVKVSPATKASGARMELRWDAIRIGKKTVKVATNLRALASMVAVEDAHIPASGSDRGTPPMDFVTTQVGGETVYPNGPTVRSGDKVVGELAPHGILADLSPNPGRGCRGSLDGQSGRQALWIFSSSACGVYGNEGLKIAHDGRTTPRGQIVLATVRGQINVRGGSGMLLRVDDPTE